MKLFCRISRAGRLTDGRAGRQAGSLVLSLRRGEKEESLYVPLVGIYIVISSLGEPDHPSWLVMPCTAGRAVN